MKKTYLIKGIETSSYKTNKKKWQLFLDFLLCKIKYKASIKDYFDLEMYKMTAFERNTFITKGKNNDLIKKYNSPKYMKMINNPLEFHKTFTKFLNYEWIELKKGKEFKDFCQKRTKILLVSNKKTKLLQMKDKNLETLFKELKERKIILIKEAVKTTKSLKNIFPNSIASVKITTLLGKILAAYLVVNGEEVIAPIDLETGKILSPAIDKENNTYENYPKTQNDILNTIIPHWEQLKEIGENLCLEVPQVGYIEWTFMVGDKKIYLVKASATPNHHKFQRPAHREHNIGFVPLIKKIEERKIEN